MVVPLGLENVLVVDDNPGDVRFIKEALEDSRWDPTVHTATSSEEALDFVRRFEESEDVPEPDVVLLDWNLSQTTGREVLAALESDHPHIPVVVMTGAQPETDDGESPVPEADEYVEKPTKPEGYIDILRSVL